MDPLEELQARLEVLGTAAVAQRLPLTMMIFPFKTRELQNSVL
jgi:hypothetical protein